jgi:hypothetical protein
MLEFRFYKGYNDLFYFFDADVIDLHTFSIDNNNFVVYYNIDDFGNIYRRMMNRMDFTEKIEKCT